MEIPTVSTPLRSSPSTPHLRLHHQPLLPAASIPHLRQLHARLLNHGARDLSLPLLSRLLSLSLSSASSSSLLYALSLFHSSSPPTSLCNRLLRELSRSQDPYAAFSVYAGMREKGISLDRFSFPPLLKAAGRVRGRERGGERGVGGEIHGLAARLGFESDAFVQTGLVGMYSAGGNVGDARRVFDSMAHRDLVAWGVMLDGYNQCGLPNEVLALFSQMQASSSPPPDEPILSTVLSACARTANLPVGTAIHSLISSSAALSLDPRLLSALIAMYASCGALPQAHSLLNSSPLPSTGAATALISAYAKAGDLSTSISLFNEIPNPDLIAWTAMINAYLDSRRPREAFSLFECMISTGVTPDAVSILAAASATAELGGIAAARHVHNLATSYGFDRDTMVGNDLIAMHAKCGSLSAAREVFDGMPRRARTIVSWTAMIHGYAIHGNAAAALHLLEQMKAANMAPNEVTYLGVLHACAHAGMVEKGKEVFNAMIVDDGIEPGVEHYGCMVDLMGRAGLLQEAMKLIEEMPVEPNVVIWGALLDACRAYGNVDLGEVAARRVLDLDPCHDGAHVLLADLYSKVGMWEEVGAVKRKMKAKGVVKERGSSWVEARGGVKEFSAGDDVDAEIRAKLEEIVLRLESEGYMVNTSGLLGEYEGEEERRKAVLMHGEKLALAFSLITGTEGLVRIAKNVRVCEDCHVFMAEFSRVFRMEVVLRDRNRFHHFRNGGCSCDGFW